MSKHDAHLEQNLQLVRDYLLVAIGEALDTVASLQHEGLALSTASDLALQLINFTGRNQRRAPRELGHRPREGLFIRVRDSLLYRLVAPARGPP